MSVLAKITLISGTPGVDPPEDVKYKIEPLGEEETIPGAIPESLLSTPNSMLIKNAAGDLTELVVGLNSTPVNFNGAIISLALNRLGPFIADDNSMNTNVLWTAAKIIAYVQANVVDVTGLTNPLNEDLNIAGQKITSNGSDVLEKIPGGVKLAGQTVLPTSDINPPADGKFAKAVNESGNLKVQFVDVDAGIPNPLVEDMDIADKKIKSGATDLLALESGQVKLGGQTVVPSLYTSPANMDLPAYVTANGRIENKTLADIISTLGLSFGNATPTIGLLGPAAARIWTGLSGKLTQDWFFQISEAALATAGIDKLVTLSEYTNELSNDVDCIISFDEAGIYKLDTAVCMYNTNASSFSADLEFYGRDGDAVSPPPDPVGAPYDVVFTLHATGAFDLSFTPPVGHLNVHYVDFGTTPGASDIASVYVYDTTANPGTISTTIWEASTGVPFPTGLMYASVRSLMSVGPDVYSLNSAEWTLEVDVSASESFVPAEFVLIPTSVIGPHSGSGPGAVGGSSLVTIGGSTIIQVDQHYEIIIKLKHRGTTYNGYLYNLQNFNRLLITKVI